MLSLSCARGGGTSGRTNVEAARGALSLVGLNADNEEEDHDGCFPIERLGNANASVSPFI